MTVDRAEMNRKLYPALKPGGTLVIADHSARAGDGVSVGKTFHRIEESALRREVEALDSSRLLKAISGATPRIHVTFRSNRRAAERWTNSCSNFRSRCESDHGNIRNARPAPFLLLERYQRLPRQFRKHTGGEAGASSLPRSGRNWLWCAEQQRWTSNPPS